MALLNSTGGLLKNRRSSLLYLPLQNNFVDTTGRIINVVGDVQISSIASRNGALFSNGGYLETANTSDINFSFLDNFRISVWIYKTTTGAIRAICSTINGAANRGYLFCINNNEVLRFQSDGANPDIVSSLTVPLNQWSFLSLSKSGNNYNFSVDNSSQIFTSTNWQNSTSTVFRIGRTPRNDFPFPFTGYMNNFRIEKF